MEHSSHWFWISNTTISSNRAMMKRRKSKRIVFVSTQFIKIISANIERRLYNNSNGSVPIDPNVSPDPIAWIELRNTGWSRWHPS